MTFDELMDLFKPGMIARRPTWDKEYTLQMKEGDVVRLHNSCFPKFNPQWRKRGNDALADDYYVVSN